MTKSFQGIDYNYRILLEPDEHGGRYGFTIEATHKASRRYSDITTVNTVLSELGINTESPNFHGDTTLDVSKTHGYRLTKKAANFLTSKHFLPYLEKQLYDDRDAGEWENREE